MTEQEKAQQLAEKIKALSKIFSERLPETMNSLEQVVNKLQLNKDHRNEWESLHSQLHTLAGTAPMFGFPELGSKAKIIEIRISTHLKSEEIFTEQIKEEIINAQLSLINEVRNNTLSPSFS